MPWVWGGLAGRAIEVRRVHVDVGVVVGWAVRGGPVGERLVLGCHGCLWRAGLPVGGLLGCSGGVLEACGRRWGACVGGGAG